MAAPQFPATITWPFLTSSVPTGSYQRTLPDNTIRTSMDVGPAKVRRRTAAAPAKLVGRIILQGPDRGAFETFYFNTTQSGALAFTVLDPDPNSAALLLCRF